MKKIVNNIFNKTGYKLLIIVAGIALAFACSDRLEEMNQNPNRITEIPNEFLFTTAVRGTFLAKLDRFQRHYGAQYAHQGIDNAWTRETDKYNDFNAQGDITEEMFRDLYKGPIKHANEAILLTSEGGEQADPIRNKMAHVIAVVNYAKLTDFFGDVPYYEGAMGKEEIYQPKYDTQEEIYADLVDRLKSSIEVLKMADPDDEGFPGADPLYDNNFTNWVRFANSFRLRLAMRARFVDPGKYNPIIAECLDEAMIEENDQSATLEQFDNDQGGMYNPWFGIMIDKANGEYNFNLGEFYIDWLKSNNDPRLYKYAAPNGDGEYVGMPNGLEDIPFGMYTRSSASIPAETLIARDQPLYIMNAAEIWLLRAEAALYNLGDGDANQLYQTGIRTSMEMLEVADSDIFDYLNNEPEATLFGDQENQLRQIATQLWGSFSLNFAEAYSSMRRTGYPVVPNRDHPDLSKGVTNGVLPSRLLYPYTVEKSVNGVNLQEAIDRMGGADKIDTRVWWDVKD